jgi:ABC-type transporter Mla subunit MlaD
MRLPLPGPRDIVELFERGAGAVEGLLGAAPRAAALLDGAAELLTRVDELLERIERTRLAAEAVVQRTNGVVSDAEDLLGSTGPLTERLTSLLDSTEPSVTKLQPALERLADTTDPAEVDALVTVIDVLPLLASRLETDVIPVMNSLSSVAPDLHDLLDVSRELNDMLGALPGLGRVKKRIDEQQEAEGRG